MTMMQSRLAGHAQNASLETDRTRTIMNKENVKESGGLLNLARVVRHRSVILVLLVSEHAAPRSNSQRAMSVSPQRRVGGRGVGSSSSSNRLLGMKLGLGVSSTSAIVASSSIDRSGGV